MLILGDCLEVLKTLPDNSVDSIVTDPPAGISFMGKAWDTFDKDMFGVKGEEGENDLKVKKNFNILPRYSNSDLQGFQNFIATVFTECIRVLKPGGHALVWAIPRTSHHTAMGLEKAGFEVRDCVYHIFGSGFPKSLNIGKAVDKIQGNEREKYGEQIRSGRSGGILGKETEIKRYLDKGSSPWEGWGTALKPAVECWWLVRKPLSEKTVAENVLKWGTGGLNIDGSRVGETGATKRSGQADYPKNEDGTEDRSGNWARTGHGVEEISAGRFPSHLIHDGSEEVLAGFPNTKSGSLNQGHKRGKTEFYGGGTIQGNYGGDSGSAARFFYCAKPSARERYNYLTCDCESPKIEAWVNEDQNQKERTAVTSQGKDTCEDFLMGDCDSSTQYSGNEPTDQRQEAIKSITSITSPQTTDSKTSDLLAQQSTSEHTQGVNSEMENGGSPVQSVEISSQSQSSTGTFQKKGGHCTGVAVPATASELYKKKSCVNCGSEVKISGHPTVKAQALMQYLIKLITPPKGTVLDPFMGSGSTGVAAKTLGFDFIGIEKEEEYFKIAEARIKSVNTLL